MAKRLQRSDKLRILRAVYKRDGSNCWDCKIGLLPIDGLPLLENTGKLPRNYPTLDHIIPAVLGGPNNRKNMRAMCQKCNSIKAHKAVFEHLPDDLETCHKVIMDIGNQLIKSEVKNREMRGQVKALDF